jgi:predicted P-loop ATPase
VPGEFGKRVIKVDGGMIEFLANGQQFIAAGTHPSGDRYQWDWEAHEDFPTLTMQQSEELWFALVKNFGIEAPSEGGLRRKPQQTDGEMVPDATLDYLEAGGHVLGYGKEEQAFITCPFAAEHTCESGETATVYFRRGTRGYEQGHFACLHAHCAGRTDMEYLDALGMRASEITALPEQSDEDKISAALSAIWGNLERRKDMKIMATVENLEKVLMQPGLCGHRIKFDEFRDEIMFAPLREKEPQWRPFKDEDYTMLRIELGLRGFAPISKEIIRDVVHRVAGLNNFDSAIEWGSRLKWDGTERIHNFLHAYFGAEDNAYTRSVSVYMMTAMAGRLLHPGCKADMVPVLVGAQGIGKSWGVHELVPANDFVEEVNLLERDADLARRMKGKLVIEIGELRGLHSRDMESIKEFITRQHESWVPKYQEFAKKYPRRCIFIGTTNQQEFLADTTGNRRWLPVVCGKVDVQAIKRDREQLWAEGIHFYDLIGGIAWNGAQTLAEAEHDNYRMTDTWADEIERWLHEEDEPEGTSPASRGNIRVADILQKALHFDLKNARRSDEMRVASILREMGYKKLDTRIDGKKTKAWALDARRA